MIPVAAPALGEEELNNVILALKSGWISSAGDFIPEFEEKFSRYCGAKYGVATSNGTVALHLALNALGIERGDEVVVPALSFIAVANAVTYCDAKPVFIDSHPDYWCMDPEKIEEKITKNTKAIIPVHLYGHPCDMDVIMNIARENKLYVVEDAAEAHGAEYKSKKAGSFGDVACFSFFGNKIITTGEGGMCITNDEELYEKMRILRDHGMDPKRKYWHKVIGFNYRMTNLQAAIGVAQLKKIDKLIKIKRKIAKIYSSRLKEVEGITLAPEMNWAKNVYWMYSILVEDSFGVSRDEVIARLWKEKIETRPLFYLITKMPPYRSAENFPVAENLSRKGINLPSSPKLTDNQIDFICEKIREIQKVRTE